MGTISNTFLSTILRRAGVSPTAEAVSRTQNRTGSSSSGSSSNYPQWFREALEANRRAGQADRESGASDIRKVQQDIDVLLAGFQTQSNVSPEFRELADKLLRIVSDGRTIAARGQPTTMPGAEWDSFQESLDAAEEFARAYIATYEHAMELPPEERPRSLQVDTGEGEGSGLLFKLLVGAAIAIPVAAGGYWIYKKVSS